MSWKLDSQAEVSWLPASPSFSVLHQSPRHQPSLINIYIWRVLRCSINCSCDALREPRRKAEQPGPGLLTAQTRQAHRSDVLRSFPSPRGFPDHRPKSGRRCFQGTLSEGGRAGQSRVSLGNGKGVYT